ncbi:MAG: proteasome-activating nucleotidase, partial [Candidatus Woesearchaeota archaeon]|nr:proteasome-activating nucleotidase [Candidatus Woesearchaeota archaeon]
FKIHSANVGFEKKIDLDMISHSMEGFSGAEIRAVVTEAGYFAIRESRRKVTEKDVMKAIDKIRGVENNTDYRSMFG